MKRSLRMAGAFPWAIVAGLTLIFTSLGVLGVSYGAVFDRPLHSRITSKGHASPHFVIPSDRKNQVHRHHGPVSSSVESTTRPPCANPKGVGVVANNGEDTVSFLNLDLNQECERLGVPSGPIGASVTPDGMTALVSSFGAQRVSLFDLTVDPPVLAGTVDTTTLVESVCISPDSRFAVTVDGAISAVDVRSIDIASRTTVNSLSIAGATGCVISDQSVTLGFFTVVVADSNNNRFRVLHLDATTGTLTDPGTTIENPAENPEAEIVVIAISPRSRSLAIATNFSSSNVTILAIDTTGQVMVVGTLPTGSSPGSLAIAPNGETAWVVNHGDGTIAKLAISPEDVVTDTGIRITIPVCPPAAFFGASGIAVNADSTEALVSNSCQDTLQQLDLINNAFTGVEIAVGLLPVQIGLPGVPPAADLLLAKAGSPNPVEVGQHLIYTVTVTNQGPFAATGVVLTNALPADVTFVSATPTQGTCSETSTVTCSLGTIIRHASATVTIVATPIVAKVITNSTSVTSDVDDPDLTNNSATVSTTVWSMIFRDAHASLGINLDTGEFTLTYLVDEEIHTCSGRRARVSDGFLSISARCAEDLRDQIRAFGGTDGSITIQLIDRTGSSARSRVIRRFSLNRAQASCVQPPAGLVSWWPGDGDAIDIISGNDGTLQNGATFGAGKVGQAFSFDGVDDAVQVADNATLRPANLTIEAWINTSTIPEPGKPAFILARSGPDGGNGYELSVDYTTGVARVDVVLTLDTFGSAFGTTNVADGSWHHIVGTYDGTTVKVYVDGVLEGATSYTAGIGYIPDDPLFIGKRQQVPTTTHFKGLVDEVTLYNRALSASEIQAISNAGGMGKCKVIRVLGIDTGAPWAYNIVSSLSRVTFTKVSAADFATVDLNLYDVLLVSETFLDGSVTVPAQTTLDALQARQGDLAAWISTGHGVVALSEPIGTGRFQWLPAAVRPSVGDQLHHDALTIVRPDHPVMSGLSDSGLSGWGTASHGNFTNPGGLEMLVSDGGTRPITLAGTFGLGKIVITDQDPDFHHFFGTFKPDQVTFVQNAINWAAIPAVVGTEASGVARPTISGAR